MRSWLSRVEAGWALDAVEAALLHTPLPHYFHASFGDKDLERGRRALERGETPIATYLEPGDEMERNRDIIDEAGGRFQDEHDSKGVPGEERPNDKGAEQTGVYTGLSRVFPETIEHADPEMGHSKTRGGETTVHPDREGVTITYGNFEIMYGPLCDSARSFSSEPNEDNARRFEHFLQRDVFGEPFPPDLRDALVASKEDLLRCAHLILTYEPQPVSLDDAEEFKPRPRRPDDDRAYRRQGFSDISFL